MSRSRRNSDSTSGICLELCIGATSLAVASSQEDRARTAHRNGDHGLEATLLRDAARNRSDAGDTVGAERDREEANEAERNHCCVIM